MSRRNIAAAFLLALALCAPAQAQKLSDAFIDIKERDLKKTYVNLAMMPVKAASIASLPESVRQVIAAEVLEYLDDEDFEVLPPQTVIALADELQALYPAPVSEEARMAIEEHTLRELFFRHAVDGIVEVNVIVVGAPFRNDKAEWGGTTQKIENKGDSFFGSVMGKDNGGNIYASTIRISIADRTGTKVYLWDGGVEVMMERVADQLEPLPVETLWQDEKRVLKAVKYAFKPF